MAWKVAGEGKVVQADLNQSPVYQTQDQARQDQARQETAEAAPPAESGDC